MLRGEGGGREKNGASLRRGCQCRVSLMSLEPRGMEVKDDKGMRLSGQAHLVWSISVPEKTY